MARRQHHWPTNTHQKPILSGSNQELYTSACPMSCPLHSQAIPLLPQGQRTSPLVAMISPVPDQSRAHNMSRMGSWGATSVAGEDSMRGEGGMDELPQPSADGPVPDCALVPSRRTPRSGTRGPYGRAGHNLAVLQPASPRGSRAGCARSHSGKCHSRRRREGTRPCHSAGTGRRSRIRAVRPGPVWEEPCRHEPPPYPAETKNQKVRRQGG